jgi:hypothetical protein
VLAFFCQELCASVAQHAAARGKTALTAAWLDAQCLPATADPSLRALLALPPLDDELRQVGVFSSRKSS